MNNQTKLRKQKGEPILPIYFNSRVSSTIIIIFKHYQNPNQTKQMGKAKKKIQQSEQDEQSQQEEEDLEEQPKNEDEQDVSEEEEDDDEEDYEEEEPKKKGSKTATPKKGAQKPAAKSPQKAPAKKKAAPASKSSASKTKQVSKSSKPVSKGAQPSSTNQNKDEKKKHFLPGQKFQTPDEEDGARAFYTSLYAQNPKSEMTKKYCLEYGLLEKDEANKLLKEFAKKK